MKTNETKIPWDPRPEDQKVDGKNFRDGKNQILRDALRFFELFPDIKATDVKCNFAVAFPLASKSDEKEVLTKEDFDEEHQDTLLSKLGIFFPHDDGAHPQPHMEETYVKLVARYLGQHSHLPSKKASEALVKGLEILKTAVQGADSVFGYALAAKDIEIKEEESRNNDVKKAIANDKFMVKIRHVVKTTQQKATTHAKENDKFVGTFKKQNDNNIC